MIGLFYIHIELAFRSYLRNIIDFCIEISLNNGKFSTGALQSRLSKGHGWVSGLGFWLEDIGVVGPVNGNKPRDLLITSMEEFDEMAGL